MDEPPGAMLRDDVGDLLVVAVLGDVDGVGIAARVPREDGLQGAVQVIGPIVRDHDHGDRGWVEG